MQKKLSKQKKQIKNEKNKNRKYYNNRDEERVPGLNWSRSREEEV